MGLPKASMKKLRGSNRPEGLNVSLVIMEVRTSHRSCPGTRNTEGNSFPGKWLYLERMGPSWTVVTLGQESTRGIAAITLIRSRVSFMSHNGRKALN